MKRVGPDHPNNVFFLCLFPLSTFPRCTPGGFGEKGKGRLYWDGTVACGLLWVTLVGDRIGEKVDINTTSCLRAAAEPLLWPFGPHVAGYEYNITNKKRPLGTKAMILTNENNGIRSRARPLFSESEHD